MVFSDLWYVPVARWKGSQFTTLSKISKLTHSPRISCWGYKMGPVCVFVYLSVSSLLAEPSYDVLFNSYTSVSRLINTEPSELLRLRLSEPIASESEGYTKRVQRKRAPQCSGIFSYPFHSVSPSAPWYVCVHVNTCTFFWCRLYNWPAGCL